MSEKNEFLAGGGKREGGALFSYSTVLGMDTQMRG
jgi:hypothetical protein